MGPQAAFRPFAHPEHPSARTMINDPVRAGNLVRRSTFRPRIALRRSLDEASRCLEYRFYNRRFASRAPVMKTPPLETLRRTPWENPPSLDFEIVPGARALPPFVPWTTPDHLAVIQPPTSLVLDGTTLASGRSTATLAPERRWDSKRRSFIGWRCSVESNPLTPLVVIRKRRRVKRPIPAG
jgi:hypothetical protein